MDWQQAVSIIIVILSAALLARQQWNKRKLANKRACGSGDCGCHIQTKEPLPASHSVKEK